MALEIEERVESLESIISQYVVETKLVIQRLEKNDKDFKDEMISFKDEMKEFKNEMLEFKDEMKEFKNEMLEFKDEMKEFKNEMKEFKEESIIWRNSIDEDRRRMNKQWGELSNKLGTLVEDLVYPSLGKIIFAKFGIEVIQKSVRIEKRLKDGSFGEFDAYALTNEFVFFNSTKTTLRQQYIDGFIFEIEKFRKFFPEFSDKKLIGVLATLYLSDEMVAYAEKKGYLVLGVGDEIMEIKNSSSFIPKEF